METNVVLEKEKFDSLKELASIQSDIASGRATLQQIKSDTEAYLTEREREMIRRIDTVLQGSIAVLAEIGKNQDSLVKYAAEVHATDSDLQAILLLFKDTVRKQEEVTARERCELEEKAEQLARIEMELKAKRSVIDADTVANEQDRKWIAEEKRLLNDRIQLLERSIKRVK